jgi:hypothetical protein
MANQRAMGKPLCAPPERSAKRCPRWRITVFQELRQPVGKLAAESLEQIFGLGKEPSAAPVFNEYRPNERRSPGQKDAQDGA